MGWKEETLLDVQVANPEMGVAEDRMIDLVTQALVGGVILWFSVSDLLGEVLAYRRRRAERKVS